MSAVNSAPPRTLVASQLLHDLRTPLNQIIGYSEMLSDDAGEKAGVLTDLQRIREAGHRILSLLEENFSAGGKALESASDEEASPREQPAARVLPAVVPGVLLVVDDDETNRDVLSRRLRRQGHVVKTAANGREALEFARESTFDLVLLDILMPEMDGYAVLREMKADEALQHIPVIMISALSEVQSVVRCVEAGAEDYLTKPFDPVLLRARIGASLDKKRGRDRETVMFEQLQRNYDRLQELEKLRDDMRNMIVHDLRTPLTGVIVGIEMLSTYGPLNEAQQEMLDIATTGGKTLLGMINDLLDIEKMESGTMLLNYEPLSADILIGGALEQVSPLARDAETTLTTAIASDLPVFAGDENKLSRTLVNLIANAIKFTPRGNIVVSAAQDPSGAIRFAVQDNGAGIPAEAFARIFERFGQVDSGNKIGTGLGLAFCKLAVEAHGGTIEVESTPGVGSRFSFEVPLKQQEPPHLAVAR